MYNINDSNKVWWSDRDWVKIIHKKRTDQNDVKLSVLPKRYRESNGIRSETYSITSYFWYLIYINLI